MALRFKGWLAENKIQQGEIAKLLGLSKTSVSCKVNGKFEWKISEVRKICETYGISADIFL